MISFDKARQIVLNSFTQLPRQKAPLQEALGRVLAEDVVSDMDMPVHNTSAMDGYACREADLDRPLQEIELIPAGAMPHKQVGEGQCSKIMTGAVVPQGADIVVMFEHTRVENGRVIVEKKTGKKNIRRQAEDIKQGEVVLRGGTRITPVEIAVLAGAGIEPVPVSAVPQVGVIATGDELVEPGQKPQGAQIRNSNGYQLTAQIKRMNCQAEYLGIAKDTPEAVDSILKQALESCDVIILSGGVSVGEFDFVPEVLRQNGIELLFEKVSVKPGKPTVFGRGQGKYFFGLPGNPVSTFVLFEVLVKPFLYGLMGCSCKPQYLKAKVEREIKRKKSGRSEFIPVQLKADGLVRGFEYHGSAHIHAYTMANGIIHIPADMTSVQQGEEVEVMLI